MRATPKKDVLIKFRGETDLKRKLVALAKRRREDLSVVLRKEAWTLVEQEPKKP